MLILVSYTFCISFYSNSPVSSVHTEQTQNYSSVCTQQLFAFNKNPVTAELRSDEAITNDRKSILRLEAINFVPGLTVYNVLIESG